MAFLKDHFTQRRFLFLAACLGALAVAKWHPRWDWSSEIIADTPRDVEALRVLEARVEAVSRKVMPAVVAVETPEGSFCSGVIMTADGLVLSQYHVSHRYAWSGDGPYQSRQPGEHASVILSDGHRLDAELLGADQTFDLSLLRLLDSGPHPYVPLAHKASLKLGDWVVKLGHPTGYRRGRPPVVRLGRVLYRQEDMFVTDCYLTGGDSGGPFFDLDGHLIGIPYANITPASLQDAFLILGIPDTANPDQRSVDRVGPFSALSSHLIRQQLEAMLHREMHALDQSAMKRFWERFKDAKETLPRPQWTQGIATAQPFHAVVRGSVESVVGILDENDQRVTMGTIVDSDGWIVTLASVLPALPKCQLSGGRAVTAEVVGTSQDYDVALLKIPAVDLRALEWAGQPPSVVGALVVAVGVTDAPLGIGIVSVPNTPSNGASLSDSKPYADYSTFFEIDIPIEKANFVSQCGGPIVDLDGKAIGIISKYREYGCTAIPADQIKRIVSELKSKQENQ